MTAYLVYMRNRFVYPTEIGVVDEPVSFIPILAKPP